MNFGNFIKFLEYEYLFDIYCDSEMLRILNLWKFHLFQTSKKRSLTYTEVKIAQRIGALDVLKHQAIAIHVDFSFNAGVA